MRCFSYVLLALAVAILPLGCSRSGKRIVIIVPDSLRGEFHIVKDSQNGQELIQEKGAWVFTIPPSGTLRVKDDRPFYLWHDEQIRYVSGTMVECDDLGVTAGVRSTGPHSSSASTEYDGTSHNWRITPDPSAVKIPAKAAREALIALLRDPRTGDKFPPATHDLFDHFHAEQYLTELTGVAVVPFSKDVVDIDYWTCDLGWLTFKNTYPPNEPRCCIRGSFVQDKEGKWMAKIDVVEVVEATK